MSHLIAKNVFFEGRVQGVGFRASVKRLACAYEVSGFVRNLDDGRVELLAEGEEEEVLAFLLGIRESGLAGHIRKEIAMDVPVENKRNFEIQ